MAIREQHGFTLIELMTTLAVAGMLLSIAVPSMRMLTNNAKQTGAVNDFLSGMHMARNSAITTNARVTMCASDAGANCENVTWQQGWIVFTDRNSNQTVDFDETIITSSTGAATLAINSGAFPAFLMYRPSGRVMNSTIAGNAGEFTVCDSRGAGHAKVIVIELSGRPRVSHTTASGSAPSCI